MKQRRDHPQEKRRGKNSANLSAIAALEPAMWLFIRLKGGADQQRCRTGTVLPCCGDAPVSVLRAKQEVL